jgi:hypothetical protein
VHFEWYALPLVLAVVYWPVSLGLFLGLTALGYAGRRGSAGKLALVLGPLLALGLGILMLSILLGW